MHLLHPKRPALFILRSIAHESRADVQHAKDVDNKQRPYVVRLEV